MPTVLITGASRRLGLDLTNRFVTQGWRVIALTRTASAELIELSQRQSELLVIESDYADTAATTRAIEQVKAFSASLELMIHNASLFEKDSEHAADATVFYDALYAVHMKLPALLNEGLREALATGSGGCIVHITDIFADNPNPDFALYCSTKAGLQNLTMSYAKKFAPQVRVNAIQPGPIKFLPSHSEQDKLSVSQQTLLNVEPGFLPVYQAIKFLYDNRFVTGESVKVDGGRSLR